MTSLYNYLNSLIGAPTQGANSTIVYLAGFFAIMLFVLFIDLLFNGIFRLFRRNK